MDIREIANKVIDVELQGIQSIYSIIDENFIAVIHLLASCGGRIVIAGIGKSAIIAQKIVATLNSTGSPAMFMHAADAVHGDLGMVQPADTVLLISNSGTTPEITYLATTLHQQNRKFIAMTSNVHSFIAQKACHTILYPILQEACPNHLAPTTSTTVQLVIGDILAVCLLSIKGFSRADFAMHHPGGMLGKELNMKVIDILQPLDYYPQVVETDSMKEVIIEISSKRMGATAVCTPGGKVIGIITDGDIRRMLEKNENIHAIQAKDILQKNPKTITPTTLLVNALKLVNRHSISQLIIEENGQYRGMLHLHDLVKEGFV